MEYFGEVLNRQTGDLETVSLGDWITITEFGERIGAGRRETRKLLFELDFLQPETSGKGRLTRMRICPWVTDMEWGKRIDRPGRPPFDVIAPEAQQWLLERVQTAKTALEEKSSGPAKAAADDLRSFIKWRIAEGMNTEQDLSTWRKFLWLSDHYGGLTQEDVASILEVTQQMVSKLSKDRHRQINRTLERKNTPLPNKNLSLQGKPWIDAIQRGLDGVVSNLNGPL